MPRCHFTNNMRFRQLTGVASKVSRRKFRVENSKPPPGGDIAWVWVLLYMPGGISRGCEFYCTCQEGHRVGAGFTGHARRDIAWVRVLLHVPAGTSRGCGFTAHARRDIAWARVLIFLKSQLTSSETDIFCSATN